MDRISTLRNIEDALTRFEEEELSLPELEREVRGVLRTYASEFENAKTFRASGNDSVDGVVVVATSRTDARDRIESLVADAGQFDVERVE